MSAPILGRPVHGPLHGPEWVRPPGNTDMRVTQDAASHAARILNGKPRAMALDIGDGAPDLDELLAPHSGVVAEARTDGSANLSIDFTLDGVTWRMVMAHNGLPHPVKVGQVLVEGEAVGHMGNTSSPSMPVALHLHWQVGWWNGSAWVWADPWPLLRQNQPAGGDMLQGSQPVSTPNRRTATLGDNTRLRAAPATGTTPILAEYPKDTAFTPDFYVQGGAVKSVVTGLVTTGWYAGWSTTPKGIEFGYFHESVLAALTPVEQTGHSDAELADAATTGAHAAATAVSGAAATAAAKYPG